MLLQQCLTSDLPLTDHVSRDVTDRRPEVMPARLPEKRARLRRVSRTAEAATGSPWRPAELSINSRTDSEGNSRQKS